MFFRTYCIGFLRTLVLALTISAYAGPVPINKPSSYPDWWFERDVINRLPQSANNSAPVWPADYPAADDYAVANMGQLKNIAQKAYEELVAVFSITYDAGETEKWSKYFMDHDDYQAVNLGQLKSIVKVHYDKLMDLGCITGYPWLEGLNGNSNHSEPDDYYVANIGQLKNLFSFDLKYFFNTSKLDSDSNSLPDSWELRYFGTIGVDPHADPNGNGVENITEYREGTDPTLNFYEGVKPIIQIIESGYGQKAIAGEFLINPLRVRILKPSDMSPWPNAPVRFSATPSEGLLSIQPDALSLLKPSINVKTDADGYAQVWLKCP